MVSKALFCHLLKLPLLVSPRLLIGFLPLVQCLSQPAPPLRVGIEEIPNLTPKSLPSTAFCPI
jgi:hypothetical protein